ncbi:PDZ domain-containing protein [Eubacterium ruminantium]|nr:PDZ domain-containing protein [Eubacterium ruminantium]
MKEDSGLNNSYPDKNDFYSGESEKYIEPVNQYTGRTVQPASTGTGQYPGGTVQHTSTGTGQYTGGAVQPASTGAGQYPGRTVQPASTGTGQYPGGTVQHTSTGAGQYTGGAVQPASTGTGQYREGTVQPSGSSRFTSANGGYEGSYKYMPKNLVEYERSAAISADNGIKSGLVYNDPSAHPAKSSPSHHANISSGSSTGFSARPSTGSSAGPSETGRVKSDTEEKKEERTSKPKEKKRKAGFAKLIAAALIFGIISGGTFYGVNYLLDKGDKDGKASVSSIQKSESVTAKTMSDTEGTGQTLNYDVAKIAADVSPSIVSITTTSTTTYQYYFQSVERETPGAGSGIIIGKNDSQLFIATNYHVIKGANAINIGFVDGEVVKATVKGYDSGEDIAVVTVNFDDMKQSTAEAISIAAVGDSDQLVVGEPVIAIGNALGYGQSVTVGYISALERKIEGFEGSYIQTDAAINPGNSGGALVNSKGQVIGINSVKYVDNTVEGMGFSIPSTKAMIIIENIINGKNGKTYFGITGADISKEYSQIYGFPTGIYVKSVENSSPAEAAGIHSGDIIVEFDGQEVYTVEGLSRIISKLNKGDKVKVKVYRSDDMGNYEKVELDVELGYTVSN